jgi:hypothetical protein
MKKKSKFLTVLLSFVPGLGHSYLGMTSRGLVFFVPTALSIIFTALLMSGNVIYDPIPLLILPFVWLAALVDSLIQVDRINKDMTFGIVEYKKDVINFNTIIPILFALFPGAGHMSLRMMKKGLQLMGLFLGTLAFVNYFRLGMLSYIIPIYFFYSLFDVIDILSNRSEEAKSGELSDEGIALIDKFFDEKHINVTGKYIGLAFILLGVIIIGDNIFFPLIAEFIERIDSSVHGFNLYELRHGIRVFVLGLLMIVGGARMIFKERKELKNEQL